MNSQESLTEQIREAKRLCNQHGLYDAADWIEARLRDQHYRVAVPSDSGTPHPSYFDDTGTGDGK